MGVKPGFFYYNYFYPSCCHENGGKNPPMVEKKKCSLQGNETNAVRFRTLDQITSLTYLNIFYVEIPKYTTKCKEKYKNKTNCGTTETDYLLIL